ncbi:hypothetical protein A4H97_09030 [Niastella yeongjuensis]|uniref:Iron dicitrate transport regulator FecR n=1 Tax=Niastella yeongjuensis TaxID=354355 RepID=A0A1V9EEE7_9BACT|nr:FecR family protein [Niastella yeongjuensis]OQP44508.1 hypothetical protein A4H97_09030 [Niastella yeongjuensis]SEO85249.1 FecR family protein [Niastella yeongjuensis]
MSPSEKDKQYFLELLAKFNNGTATTQECAFVEKFLAIMDHRKTGVLADFGEEKHSLEKEMEDRLLQSIRQDTENRVRRSIVHRVHFLRRAGWWAAAAAIIVLMTGTVYWFLNTTPKQQPVAGIGPVNDVQPGRQGAYLTLADGRRILLDSLGDGLVASEKGAQVVMKAGELSYNPAMAKNAVTTYNTISTPKGRQFALQLPDGSKVWLNAASSLRYPVVFVGAERRVEITGEAYFEVSKIKAAGKRMPFIVSINNKTTVEVLGTHFNVNAYNDERSINTTLLEGAVKVSHEKQIQLLQPGQQAQVNSAGSINLVKDADVTAAVAWKNGSFSFANASLETVMRQLARWYDVEVEFEGEVPGGAFSGEIDRSLTLDQVLKGLTKTRVHYTIQKNNKLLIEP